MWVCYAWLSSSASSTKGETNFVNGAEQKDGLTSGQKCWNQFVIFGCEIQVTYSITCSHLYSIAHRTKTSIFKLCSTSKYWLPKKHRRLQETKSIEIHFVFLTLDMPENPWEIRITRPICINIERVSMHARGQYNNRDELIEMKTSTAFSLWLYFYSSAFFGREYRKKGRKRNFLNQH